MTAPSWRGPAAEAIGTAMLLAAVVGSGIMAERLAGGNVAIALLANAIATGGALFALIVTFAPISGAHFNPAVTLVLAWRRAFPWARVPATLAAQCVGAVLGVWLAHLMFDVPILQLSSRVRTGIGQWTGEVVATFGLIALVLSGLRHDKAALPAGIAAYITAAYWFTASTSFANPAVTIARAFSDSFAGIAAADMPGFIVAQAIGALLAAVVMRRLLGYGRTGAP